MESNPANAEYSEFPQGRYTGITNGYFLDEQNAN